MDATRFALLINFNHPRPERACNADEIEADCPQACKIFKDTQGKKLQGGDALSLVCKVRQTRGFGCAAL